MGPKQIAAFFERFAELPEIVDFAVENDSNRACFVEYGLVPPGKVNDAEAAHSQRRRRGDKAASSSSPQIPQRLHHPACNRFSGFGFVQSR